MYTKGITKIFAPPKYRDLTQLLGMTLAAGYKAVSHNGDIYVVAIFDKTYTLVETPFKVEDYEG